MQLVIQDSCSNYSLKSTFMKNLIQKHAIAVWIMLQTLIRTEMYNPFGKMMDAWNLI